VSKEKVREKGIVRSVVIYGHISLVFAAEPEQVTFEEVPQAPKEAHCGEAKCRVQNDSEVEILFLCQPCVILGNIFTR